ncbi:PIN domain-containing protein [Streptomyces rubiginosohelvolus]|uniref:PIN domain-containing protein n=1 Tax=Streptomyces rubiginosohelvolus TaxID=67362 RepID=UPI0033BA535B
MPESLSGSFTSGYEQFWRKSTGGVEEAIKSSLIVLDTNAVLNLYRMKPSAREEYFRVLSKIRSRIWIPRQVADEFHQNRLSSVSTHVNSLKSKADSVAQASEDLRSALRDFYKLHSIADGKSNEYLNPLDNMLKKITTTVSKEVSDFDLSPEGLLSRDSILERLDSLFDGRVGDAYSEDDQKEITAEALRRGKGKVPPGYVDVQKKAEKGVGDYFIWHQMLAKAKSDSVDILFISTDVKEDWVRVQCGFTIGPRPELVREMRNVAGVSYHQLPLAVFLSEVSRVLNVRVSQDTIDQVNERIPAEAQSKKRARERGFIQRRLREAEERLSAAHAALAETEDAMAVSAHRIRAVRSLLEEAQTKHAGDGEAIPVRNALIDLDVAQFQHHQALGELRKAQQRYEEERNVHDAYSAQLANLLNADRSSEL